MRCDIAGRPRQRGGAFLSTNDRQRVAGAAGDVHDLLQDPGCGIREGHHEVFVGAGVREQGTSPWREITGDRDVAD